MTLKIRHGRGAGTFACISYENEEPHFLALQNKHLPNFLLKITSILKPHIMNESGWLLKSAEILCYSDQGPSYNSKGFSEISPRITRSLSKFLKLKINIRLPSTYAYFNP